MPNRSKRDIVDRIKLLEEEVYPDGVNTPEVATAGESGGLESVNTDEAVNGQAVFISGDIRDNNGVNNALQNLAENEVAVLTGRIDVDENDLVLPSGATVLNHAHVRRKDGIDGDNIRLVRNEDHQYGGADSDITFINLTGKLDGNVQNQDTSYNNRYAFSMKGVTNLEFHGLHVVNPFDWSANIRGCDNVRFSDFYADTGNADSNQDGLHFSDTSNIRGNNVSGTSEDDLLAIGMYQDDVVENITIHGVQGASTNANGVKLLKASAIIGDGNEKRMKNVEISGINIRSTDARGVIFLGDEDTYFENVDLDGQVHDSQRENLIATGGTLIDCTIDLDCENPGPDHNNVRLFNTGAGVVVQNCDLDFRMSGAASGRPSLIANDIQETDLHVNLTRPDQTSNGLEIQGGRDIDITGRIETADTGIRLGVDTGVEEARIHDMRIKDCANHGINSLAPSNWLMVYNNLLVNASTRIVGADSVEHDNVTR